MPRVKTKQSFEAASCVQEFYCLQMMRFFLILDKLFYPVAVRNVDTPFFLGHSECNMLE